MKQSVSIFDEDEETTSDRVFREVARPERAGARVVFGTMLTLLVLLGVGYVVLYALAGDRVPRGARVEGVHIGGMTPARAEQVLRASFAAGESTPVLFRYDGRVHRIVPALAGLRVDYAASVTAAGGHRSWRPQRLWDYFTGGDDQQGVVTTDKERLRATLDALSQSLGKPAVEGSVRFRDGHAEAVYGHSGLQVNAPAFRMLLSDRIFHPASAQLPVSVKQPYISRRAVQHAMNTFGRRAMSAPVVIVIGQQPVVAPPQLFSRALTMIPSDNKLVPVVDGPKLVDALEPVMTTIGDKPRNAQVRMVHGRPQVVPAVVGASYDVTELAEQFPTYAARPLGQRRLILHAATQAPRVSTVAASRLGVRSVVAAYHARLPGNSTVRTNLTGLAHALDGALVRPGATFSLADRLGSRMGGADVPRLATAVFNAAFDAGMADAGHLAARRHLASQPLGREVYAGPGADLRFRNGTPYGVMVGAVVNGDQLTVRLWSTRYWDVGSSTRTRPGERSTVTFSNRAGCRPQHGKRGKKVTVTRRLRLHDTAKVRDTHAYPTSYAAVATIRCRPEQAPPTTSTTTSTTPSGVR